MTVMPETADRASELVLEAPSPVPTVTSGQAASSIRVDEATRARISAAVDAFVNSITSLDAESPEFQNKVSSISRMGNEEIRRSSEASSRFLDRPSVALKDGPLAEGSQVSAALLALRQQIEGLDPSRHLQQRRRFLSRIPLQHQVNEYFRKYQSAQSNIEAIVQSLYRGQDELLRDNAAIEQEKIHVWAIKTRLEQYALMAATLDETLSSRIAELELTDTEKARALKEDALFYVRQKRQDILTQLSVTVQGYLALNLIRKNNQELIKGVERASTTTVAALRTAVIAALALGNQRLVLNQINALNNTTGTIIESTSVMLRQQTTDIQNQAASATIGVEKLQAAFNNIYATMESIDTFKLQALASMKQTIDSLSGEVARAQVYVERARTSELAELKANGLASELTLPASRPGA